MPCIAMLLYPILFCIIGSTPFLILMILLLLFLDGDSSRAPSVMVPLTHYIHAATSTGMLLYLILVCLTGSISLFFLMILLILFVRRDSSRAPSVTVPSTHDTCSDIHLYVALSYFVLHNRKHISLFFNDLDSLVCR